jgi:hypothetical protein
MSATVAAIRGPDGRWRSGLLDPDSYDLPEISGSAFFTYAIAYGINQHILDRKQYLPVVQRAWAGILTHVYTDGRAIRPLEVPQINLMRGQRLATSTQITARVCLSRIILLPERDSFSGFFSSHSTHRRTIRPLLIDVTPW